ncbi:pyruvate kinase [Sorangium cellulosum]|uniref:Pyruvate kinase n=1 Tax=Sorangium cellulosum TaxID=56 RepID=A0A2L0F041_SORCE|nr:pyruvate kinase [Sorangium cellulosum]AUX44896.1 pyruvate kinase [Sorangium cellulosum]
MSYPDPQVVEHAIAAVEALRGSAVEHEHRYRHLIEAVHPAHRAGATNLLHYLAVRQHDVRDLQRQLASLGLSSLGRMERCALSSLDAVLCALDALARRPGGRAPGEPPTTFTSGESLLDEHTAALLGEGRPERQTRVMVTLPTDVGKGEIRRLLEGGMEVARINCSKGDAGEWAELVGRLRGVARKLGIRCKILCDIAGPNPRVSKIVGDPPRVSLPDSGARARIWLCKDVKHARASLGDAGGDDALLVGCTIPEIIDDLRPGHRVFYDDGKLGGTVTLLAEGAALIEVDFARQGSVKLKPGKGLNFPDTELGIPSLTPKDLEDLDFIAQSADMVGLSFVRSPSDVERVQAELEARGAAHLGIVLKVETTPAFEQLPRLLLAAMRSERVGVMLARGDMAVEMGFVRLAEVQEELLWLCEAALVPAIWATQVLESLNKTGVPTRGEVTDAAMSSRAECVMLNQGENIVATVGFMVDVLQRMQQHQDKKRALMRPLSVSRLE